MILTNLKLRNFRNLNLNIDEFSSENNILVGENGSGKTNFIESIYISGMIKSFRGVHDKELVNNSKDYYFLKAGFTSNESKKKTSVEIGFDKRKKKIKIDNNIIKKVNDLIGKLPIVVFRNEDIEIVLGSPQTRRRYIDVHLSLTSPNYLKILQDYVKVLKYRNLELKKCDKITDKYNPLWEEQLIDYGSKIVLFRKRFFDKIAIISKPLFEEMNMGKIQFDIIYKDSTNIESTEISEIKQGLKDKIDANRSREILYGQTLYGPHKDDFYIKSGRSDFKRFASQGQNRAAVMSIMLAAVNFMEEIKGEKVILLLDDILLDLDDKRKEAFLSLIKSNQCFFTATSLAGLNAIKRNCKIFTIDNDKLESI